MTVNSATHNGTDSATDSAVVDAPTGGYNELVDRYVASWNEADADLRHKLVEGLWAKDCRYFNRLFAVQSREVVEFAIGRAHEEYAAKGFSFKSQNNAYGHHQGMMFSWVMVKTATGEVDTFGQDFVLLDDEGLITADYQFAMKRPSV